MSNPIDIAARSAMLQSSNMGNVYMTQDQINAGYTTDGRNVFYPDGTIAYGPDVLALTRTRTGGGSVFSNVVPVGGVYTLPNGQQLTQEQYAALLAAQGGPPSQIASGIGGAFTGLAQSFGVSPTTLVLLLIAGGVLLFRDPPSRKR